VVTNRKIYKSRPKPLIMINQRMQLTEEPKKTRCRLDDDIGRGNVSFFIYMLPKSPANHRRCGIDSLEDLLPALTPDNVKKLLNAHLIRIPRGQAPLVERLKSELRASIEEVPSTELVERSDAYINAVNLLLSSIPWQDYQNRASELFLPYYRFEKIFKGFYQLAEFNHKQMCVKGANPESKEIPQLALEESVKFAEEKELGLLQGVEPIMIFNYVGGPVIVRRYGIENQLPKNLGAEIEAVFCHPHGTWRIGCLRNSWLTTDEERLTAVDHYRCLR
jgi:hypothetical protein